MRFKKVLSYITNLSTNERKLILKSFYYKYLIISDSTKFEQRNFSIDNFYKIKETIHLPKMYTTKIKLVGYSLNVSDYICKSVHKIDYSLKIPLSFETFLSSNLLFRTRTAFFNKSTAVKPILFISSVKGGFTVFSAQGVKGFLPKTQFKRLKLCNQKYSLRASIFPKKFSLVWFFAKILKVSVNVFKKNSRLKAKGRHITRHSFIFLSSYKLIKRVSKRKKYARKSSMFKTKAYNTQKK